MNKTQGEALKKLSKAFSECKKVKLCFQGMDGDLLAFDEDKYIKLTKNESIYEQQYKKNGDQGVTVDTHGCYMDSGGW